ASSRSYPTFTLTMGRSPGFASTTSDSVALLGLAFATATWLNHLALPEIITRRLIMQKARRHPDHSGLRPLVGVWFQVLFHPLIQGTFHLSLTVLVHYRSLSSI